MKKEIPNYSISRRPCHSNASGIVLLVTLVFLVVLSTLGYTLSAKVAARRHRDNYIIDYSQATYACASAVKYAFAAFEDTSALPLINRAEEPDFSDEFALTQTEYDQLLEDWKELLAAEETDTSPDTDNFDPISQPNDINDTNETANLNKSNLMVIRGPYGPPWPFVIKPIQLQIGSATITIEIEDENAKYPIGWVILEDKKIKREALAGFENFCEWMDINDTDIDLLHEQLRRISKIKPFRLDFKPVVTKKTIAEKRKASRSRRRRGRNRRPKKKVTRKTTSATIHYADFAKLFHSHLLDTELLARPTIESDTRKESALKYTALWASSKVNINSAPRHVLESAFIFGGDEVEIAEEVIYQRQIKPFKNFEDLKKRLFRYSVSLEKCKNYITTVSNLFTIRVTAVSGVAKVSAIMAVFREGNKKIKKIGLIQG